MESPYDTIMKAGTAAIEKFMDAQKTPPRVITRLDREVGKIQRAVRAAKKELQYSNLDRFQRDEINTKIFLAAQERVKELIQDERVLISRDLEKEKIRFQRDSELNSAKYDKEYRDYTRRLSGMSNAEVLKEMRRIENDSGPVRPEILDAISSEVKRVSPEDHTIFRETVAKRGLYETHRFTPEGARLTQREKVYANFSDGGYVPVEYQNGNIAAESLKNIIEEV